MKTRGIKIAVFFMTLMVSILAGTLQSGAGTLKITRSEMSPYTAHIIRKPQDYAGLRQWVERNYTDDDSVSIHYLPETVYDVTIDDGKSAISFETWQHDHYVRNTLVDAGKVLKLYTILDPEFDPEHSGEELDFLLKVQPGIAPKASASCNDTYKCNCVLWVRNCKAPWLPYGMTYIWEKKAKINTQEAKDGRVAVMDIYYPYGHVAYITNVNGSKITVQEANYAPCQVTTRTGTSSSMKIVGYIKP